MMVRLNHPAIPFRRGTSGEASFGPVTVTSRRIHCSPGEIPDEPFLRSCKVFRRTHFNPMPALDLVGGNGFAPSDHLIVDGAHEEFRAAGIPCRYHRAR